MKVQNTTLANNPLKSTPYHNTSSNQCTPYRNKRHYPQ